MFNQGGWFNKPTLPESVSILGNLNYRHFCRIRDGGVPMIFEGRNLAQQTIYHWKGDLSKSPIHFRYGQNILISRLYEQFLRNDSVMAPEKNSNF